MQSKILLKATFGPGNESAVAINVVLVVVVLVVVLLLGVLVIKFSTP